MKRNTTIAVLLIGLLAVSGLIVGAASFDQLFADNNEIRDDEIVLTTTSSSAGTYANITNGNLSISIDDLNADSSVTINDTFKAQYNGTEGDGYIYFETGNSNVTIIDSNGNPVDSSTNSYNFTSQGENESFGVEVDATNTSSVSISSINVVAGAKQPTASTVTATFKEAEVVEGDGNTNDLTVSVEDQNGDSIGEGQQVNFTVLQGDGADPSPATTNDNGNVTVTYTQTSNDVAGDTIKVEAEADGVTTNATYDVVNSTPDAPTTFNGTVTNANGVVPPENTTIVATVNGGSVRDNTTTQTDGQYGGEFASDKIELEGISAGDEIRFYVREKAGNKTSNIENYTVSSSEVGTNIQQDLKFPAGTFDLKVEDLSVNKTNVFNGDTIEVSANITNDGSETLTQEVNLTIDGATDQTQSVSVDGGNSTSVSYTYTVGSSDINVGITTADDSSTTTVSPIAPTTFNGTVEDSVGVTAPSGTEIVATVNGSVVDNTSVDSTGNYGDSGSGSDIALEITEDENVRFFVREASGPAYTNNPITVPSADIGTTVEENLTFPEATFDLQVTNFKVNDTTVSKGDTIKATADLVNNGSVTLSQDANLTIDGASNQTQSVSVDGGTSQSVSFTYTVPSTSDFDVAITTADDSSAQKSIAVSSVAIENIDSTSVDHNFVGIVNDDDALSVSATNVTNASGQQVTGTVPLYINTSEAGAVEFTTVEVNSGSIDASVDPTNVSADASLGDATIDIGTAYTPGTSLTLVHEAQNVSTGASVISVPQAAQLHSEGQFSATMWDASSQSYSSDAFTGHEFKSATLLHRGIYILTQDAGLRIGYEFQSASPATSVELSQGWNLVGTNYNVSAGDGTTTIENDLGSFASDTDIVDANSNQVLYNTSSVSAHDAYWVYSSSSQTRSIDSSSYNATVRAGQ